MSEGTLRELLKDTEQRIGAQMTTVTTTVQKLIETVTDHRVDNANKLGKIQASIEHIGKEQSKTNDAVNEVRRNQANCDARMNYQGTKTRIRQLERKQSDTRIKIASMNPDREDTTGQVDVTQRMPLSPNTAQPGSKVRKGAALGGVATFLSVIGYAVIDWLGWIK